MIHIFASTRIDAPVEQVWEVLRAFDAIGEWLPGVVSCALEGEGGPNTIGAVRLIDMGERGLMREKLVGLSDADKTLTFTIVESPMPIQNYRSTMRLLPITDGGATYLSWSGDFDTSPEHAAEMRRGIPEEVYQPGFDRLKKRFAKV